MRWIARAGALVVALALLSVAAPRAGAVGLQTIGTFSSPVFVTSDPANPNRLFVVERGGTIELWTPSGTSTFVDLTSRVQSGGEQGLLSMAFAPDYARSGLFYVYYTGKDSGSIHIAELRATGNVADPATIRNVITIPHPVNTNHNGGQLEFGPDGYLYAATGDGGGGGDRPGNAQNLDVLLGKMIRIDPSRNGTAQYSVPRDNPFVGIAGRRPEIWSYGLRNPFRFSFDRLTGALTIGDVGQGAREEIDYALQPHAGRGVNFGWNCREGLIAYGSPAPACAGRQFTDPVHDYPHSNPQDPDDQGCAIIGGYVVRDPGLSSLYGRYVYSDSCTGGLRSIVLALPSATGDRSERLQLDGPSSFGEDSCGRVYVASLNEGTVSRLVDSTPTDCTAAPPTPERCSVQLQGDRRDNELNGGPGSQAIDGRAGRDRIRGGSGDDCIAGGPGGDVLSGNGGTDVIRGGPGGDVLRARDGERDRLICGAGRDRAIVDGKDVVRGCERKRSGRA